MTARRNEFDGCDPIQGYIDEEDRGARGGSLVVAALILVLVGGCLTLVAALTMGKAMLAPRASVTVVQPEAGITTWEYSNPDKNGFPQMMCAVNEPRTCYIRVNNSSWTAM